MSEAELMHGTAHDENGISWECEWLKVPGPGRLTTRVMLRRSGEAGPYTHYYDAHHPADVFNPQMINRAFTAVAVG